MSLKLTRGMVVAFRAVAGSLCGYLKGDFDRMAAGLTAARLRDRRRRRSTCPSSSVAITHR